MTSFGVTYPQRHYSGQGPRGYQRSDDRIREDVCDRLTDDPWVDASEVEVTVRGGEVTLSGSVRDRNDKRRTEDMIEGISGVREVHNNLRVTSGVDTGTRPQATTGTTPPTTTRR
jgi:osmotically-inducible protein OsmY